MLVIAPLSLFTVRVIFSDDSSFAEPDGGFFFIDVRIILARSGFGLPVIHHVSFVYNFFFDLINSYCKYGCLLVCAFSMNFVQRSK